MTEPVFCYDKLNGKIREVFGTQYNFAKAIKIGRVALNAKLNNKSEFSQKEIFDACDALGISKADIPIYFFDAKVQKHELVT